MRAVMAGSALISFAVILLAAGEPTRAQSQKSTLQAVPFTAVKIEEGLWGSRLQTNRRRTVGHLLDMCELEGRVRNMCRAAGRLRGRAEGIRKRDADLEYGDDLLGGVVVITGTAKTSDEKTIPLVAVPYGVWGNREVGEMDVWIR